MADVFPIENSGISDREYEFALKSHFDFIVEDKNFTPLFAVEFDGPLHRDPKQQERDKIKNALCTKFELPLLRINSKYLEKTYRGMDLLSWFIEVWFAQAWFDKAQESGEIPFDEMFMPQMMMIISGYEKQFPLWLSAPINSKIEKLCLSGKIIDSASSYYIGKNQNGIYKAISYIRITKEKGVMVDTAMHKQNFPISLVSALEEIITFLLYQRLMEGLNLGKGMIPLEQITTYIQRFEKEYEMRGGFWVGGGFTDT